MRLIVHCEIVMIENRRDGGLKSIFDAMSFMYILIEYNRENI